MSINDQPDWRSRCRSKGLDPHEVKAVSSRFDMYHDYNVKQGIEPMELPRWYKWYRIEKLSEGHAMQAPPVQGCSVEPGAEAESPVVSEEYFLNLLLEYRAGGKKRR